MGALDEYITTLARLPPAARHGVVQEAMQATKSRRWVPNPGPQTTAYLSPADETLYGGEAGGGKLLALDTPLPTPFGWTTMGEVQPGDTLFDDGGLQCKVTFKSKIQTEDTYRVEFSDGSSVIAGARHQWVTRDYRERMRALLCSPEYLAARRSTRPPRSSGKRADLSARNVLTAKSKNLPRSSIRTTAEMYATMKLHNGRLNYSIDVARPLQVEPAQLLIDPYVLGAWIGDGTSQGGAITGIDEEIFQEVANAGYTISRRADPITPGILGLRVQLRVLGLIQNKHIPAAYLRASQEQRLSLLQGLMDTDGYCDTRGQCELTTVKRRIAEDTLELLASLGIKCAIAEGAASLNGRTIGPKYRLKFITELPAFRLPRKLIRQKRSGFRGTHDVRYITDIVPVDRVPMQCVQVDSPNRMYLCGKTMIPTHNTDLIVGLSLTEHARSLVLRRTNAESSKLFDRYEEIIGDLNGKNEQKGWRIDGRIIDIGGVQLEGDKQKRKGVPHDLIAFDELVDFTRTQYEFIIAWNRSKNPEQRCRIVGTTNPPTRPEGMWVVERWGPWLDPKHPKPAKDGELRWYTTINGRDTEVDGRGPHDDGSGHMVLAKSRTFIRAKLQDNPDLTQNTDYESRLAALPRELREAYMEGRFEAGLKDTPFQAIPTDWIRAAQERWTEKPPKGIPMCGIGVDASGGGEDPMVLAIRHDGWYAPMVKIPGKEIPSDRPGKFAAGIVISYRRDRAAIVVDMGGGYGGPLYEQLRDNEIEAIPHKGAEASVQRTLDGQLRFKNKRTQVIWRFREALDPSQPGGSPIALPPSPTLLADLAAPTFWPVGDAIQIESKEDVCDRLQRSTDEGDAVVMAWSAGPTYVTDGDEWARAMKASRPLGRMPQVVMGRQNRRNN